MHSSCLSLFPASPWTYSNKPITPFHMNQGVPTLLILQRLDPTAPCLLGSWGQFMWVCRARHPPTLGSGYVTNKLLSISFKKRNGDNSWFYTEIDVPFFHILPHYCRKKYFRKQVRKSELLLKHLCWVSQTIALPMLYNLTDYIEGV